MKPPAPPAGRRQSTRSHAQVRLRLPWVSVLWRFLLVCLLVFATYNPSNFTLTAWIVTAQDSLVLKALVAFSLVALWIVMLRFATQGLTRLGMFFVVLAIITLALLERELAFFGGLSPFGLVIAIEIVIAVFITFGLVFSYWTRQATGASPVVKHPP